MHLHQDTLLQGGKYRIVRFISAGGFGCTYEGLHVMLKKRVAIKEFFVKDFCNRDEADMTVSAGITSKTALVNKLKNKFIEEAQSVNALKHPNIVNVYDVFEENGTAYYVMDYIDGASLNDIVKENGALSEKKAVKYILQVADALKYVHSCNRLHLDIKPGNIMIDKDDNAILIDFGTSKQYDEEAGENTSTLMGKTPGYAPLEQMGNDVVKFMPSTDIYALGATLYKLLTGITPPSATLLASGEELDPIPSSVSENVRNSVYKAMQTNKNKRPQTVLEFVSIIEVNTSKPVTPSVGPEEDDETTQVVYQEKKKSDLIADERERLLKDALTKAEKEKAEAETRAKAEKQRRTKEEEPRHQKKERNAERYQVLGCVSWIGALVIGGGLYFSGVLNHDRGSEPIPEPQKIRVTHDPVKCTDGTLAYYWTGELVDGIPQGKGKIHYDRNDKDKRYTYEGNVENGARNDANATLQYRNGNSFVGSFENDNFKQGRLTLRNDGVYFDGTFKDNQPWNGKWYFIQDNSLYSTVVDGKEKAN